MSNQGIVGIKNFRTEITRIGKIASKMFRFQMVPHVRSRMIEKIITKSTTKFSQRIFPKDNVLVKISWPTDRCSTSFWKKILTFNKRLYYYMNFHYTCIHFVKVEKSALKKRKIKKIYFDRLIYFDWFLVGWYIDLWTSIALLVPITFRQTSQE